VHSVWEVVENQSGLTVVS